MLLDSCAFEKLRRRDEVVRRGAELKRVFSSFFK